MPAADAEWNVEFHREVAKDITGYGLCDKRFSPTLRELIAELEQNPKQFPKKQGKLKGARAADLTFQKTTYRAVFILDEAARVVLLLSLDPHDVAYARAEARLKSNRLRIKKAKA